MRKLLKKHIRATLDLEPDNPSSSRSVATSPPNAGGWTPPASRSGNLSYVNFQGAYNNAAPERQMPGFYNQSFVQQTPSPPPQAPSSPVYLGQQYAAYSQANANALTTSREVPLGSVYSLQDYAPALQGYPAPTNAPLLDPQGHSSPSPVPQAAALLTSSALRTQGHGPEQSSTISSGVPIGGSRVVQQTRIPSATTITSGPQVEAKPESSTLSIKNNASLSSNPDVNPVVHTVPQNAGETHVASGTPQIADENVATRSVSSILNPGTNSHGGLMDGTSKNEGDALSKEDLKPTVVAVLGLTGAGKSTFIRNITSDESVIIGHSYRSETLEVKAHSTVLGGANFVLIDTPGFNDTYRPDEEIFKSITDWLTKSFKANAQLHGIIYLHRIDIPRVAGSSLRSIRILELLCGQEVYPNITLAMTGWEVLDEMTKEARAKELSENDNFWRGLRSKGAKMVHLPKDEDAQRQMFLEMEFGEHITLQIQKKMAVDNDQTILDIFAEAGLSTHFQGLKVAQEEQMQGLKQKHTAQMASADSNFAAESSRIQADKKKIEEGERQLRERDAEIAAKIRADMAREREDMARQREAFEAERQREKAETEQRLKAMEEALAQALSPGPSPSVEGTSTTEGAVVVHHPALPVEQQPQSGYPYVRRELHSEPTTYREQLKDSLAQARAQREALVRAAKSRQVKFTFGLNTTLSGFCDVCFRSLGLAPYLGCKLCLDKGGFACCNECRDEGRWCLDNSHDMTWNNREILSAVPWLWSCKHAKTPPGYASNYSGRKCNGCKAIIKGVYAHCCQCDDDEFDLCLQCSFAGKRCAVRSHVFHMIWAPIHVPEWKRQTPEEQRLSGYPTISQMFPDCDTDAEVAAKIKAEAEVVAKLQAELLEGDHTAGSSDEVDPLWWMAPELFPEQADELRRQMRQTS